MRNTILPRSTLMSQSVYQNSLLESESSHSGCCITRYDQKLLKTASVVFATQFASLLLRIFTLAINHVYNLGQVLCESSSLGNSLSLVGFFFTSCSLFSWASLPPPEGLFQFRGSTSWHSSGLQTLLSPSTPPLSNFGSNVCALSAVTLE